MSKSLNAFYCKYGPWLIISILIFLVMISQFDSGASMVEPKEDLGLPKPVLQDASYNSKIENTYSTKANERGGESITFVVRTYKKFSETQVLQRLLHGLNNQSCKPGSDPSCKPTISTILLSTDSDSLEVVEQDAAAYMQKHGKSSDMDVYVHKVPKQVYGDNCCQIEEMCHGAKFAKEWATHAKLKYGHYRSFEGKLKTVCSGNNMLHYLLTDMALRHVVDSCTSDCDHKYVVLTNGDNEYSANFAYMVMDKLNGDPTADFVMTDYLERGNLKVESTVRLNQMDLGCMVFRISFLQRMFPSPIMIYLSSLPGPNTWPSHYYGADGEFVMTIVKERGARVEKVNQVLFTHW